MTFFIFPAYQRPLSCQKSLDFGRAFMLSGHEDQSFSLPISKTTNVAGNVAEWDSLENFIKAEGVGQT
jgi:hypothetical protein